MLNQLTGDVADDNDAVSGSGDGPAQRRQVIGRKGYTTALGRPAAGFALVFGALSRFGALAPFLRLAALRLGLDRLPMMEKLVVGGERNAPDLVISIPSREGHLPDLLDQLTRIGRPDAKAVLVDTEIGAEDRFEGEGIPPPLLCKRIGAGFFLGSPAVEAAPSRLSRDEPCLAPIAPAGTGKFLPETLDRHPVERKPDGGTPVAVFTVNYLGFGVVLPIVSSNGASAIHQCLVCLSPRSPSPGLASFLAL